MKFNIAYAPDDKYINQTVVSIKSAIENNKEHELEFIIIYSKLSEESLRKLNAEIPLTPSPSPTRGEGSVARIKLRLLQVDENIFAHLPLSHWVTVQAWFRIKLPDLCPDLDTILYL